jgi:Na+/phosphate symporter
MSKKNNPPQFSTTISDFCNMVTEVVQDYEWNKSEVNRLDRLTQDYLHQLELNDLDYRERAKVATQLTKCRQLRRASKDTVEILEPFVEFIESDKGKQTMNLMREALGKTRKVERYMENRTYRYRVLDQNTAT